MKTGSMKTDLVHLAFDVCVSLLFPPSQLQPSSVLCEQTQASLFVFVATDRVMETAI